MDATGRAEENSPEGQRRRPSRRQAGVLPAPLLRQGPQRSEVLPTIYGSSSYDAGHFFFSTNVQSCGCHVLHRMIEDAEERGLISPGATTLVEPTSGNMGIALAYIALARGYRFVAVMPAEYSLDKQILLRYLGADLVLTGKEVKVAAHRHRCPLVSRLQDWPARLLPCSEI